MHYSVFFVCFNIMYNNIDFLIKKRTNLLLLVSFKTLLCCFLECVF